MSTSTLSKPTTKKALIEKLNFGTAVVSGVLVSAICYYLAKKYLPENPEEQFIKTRNDQQVLIAMIGWFVGFMAGIGALIGPFRWILGKDLKHDEMEFYAGKDQGWRRYWRYTTDHKVVGIQYLVVTMLIFFVGGILAMLIRTNLAHPGGDWIQPQSYNAIVGIHGIIMIVGTIIMVTGPFGNFVMPIMIGAKDMAFPRLNALSFG